MALKKVLFILESPFQILGAFEFIKNKEIDNYRLIVRYGNNIRNNQQIYKTLLALELADYKIVNAERRGIVTKILFVLYLFFKSLSYDLSIFGDSNSYLYKVIKKLRNNRKLLLLDDGVASLVRDEREVGSYSFFKSLEREYSDHQFGNLRELLDNKQFPERNVLVVVGSKLVRVGAISSQTYSRFIQRVVDWADDKNYEIQYIPHRGESSEVIQSVIGNKPIKILKNELPIELFSIEFGFNPKAFVSICSTSLFTLDSLYKSNVEVYFYRLNEDEITARLDNIVSVYNELDRHAGILEI